MSGLEEHLYQKVSQEMRSWEPLEACDIYLITLHIAFVDDDMRQGMLSGPCYNTLRHWQSGGGTGRDKWETSEHQHCASFSLCEPVVEEWGNEGRADPLGVDLRDKHFADLSLFITDTESDHFWKHLYRKKGGSGRPGFPLFTPEDAQQYDAFRERLSKNGQAFVDACAGVVRRLHDAGVVQQVCGRPVPVILDVSNDMDALTIRAWRLTRQVNPFGVADECVGQRLGFYGLKE